MTPDEATVFSRRTVRCVELPEGPPLGGPSNVLGPGGRIRTGICRRDSSLLYQLSYPGSVPLSLPMNGAIHKMALADEVDPSVVGRQRSALRQRVEMTPDDVAESVSRRSLAHQS